MRVSIHTLGTRGDVQPFVALAVELVGRGHSVQIAAPAQFGDLVGGREVGFTALPAEFLALLDTPAGRSATAGGRSFGARLSLLREVRPMMRRLLHAEWEGVRAFEPDLLVHHPKSLAAPHIAERLGRPYILASPLPGFTPTSAFPSPILPFASLGPFNRLSHGLAVRGGELLFGRQIRDWRTGPLGLGRRRPAGGAPLATLYAYSPEVVPVPPDWGPDVLVSGYWFLDSPDWRPDAELAAFLAAGEPPVHIGFGSMSGTDGSRSVETAVGALAKAGKRGLLALGDGRRPPGSLPDNIHAVEHAPHDRLFPLVSATVHHGGAGTTGASLRAGKPMVICPFFGDQPFWGRRVSGLGAGRVLARGALSEESLAAAIAALDDEETRARAAALGDAIRRERGAASAADFIERTMREGRGRQTAIGP